MWTNGDFFHLQSTRMTLKGGNFTALPTFPACAIPRFELRDSICPGSKVRPTTGGADRPPRPPVCGPFCGTMRKVSESVLALFTSSLGSSLETLCHQNNRVTQAVPRPVHQPDPWSDLLSESPVVPPRCPFGLNLTDCFCFACLVFCRFSSRG